MSFFGRPLAVQPVMQGGPELATLEEFFAYVQGQTGMFCHIGDHGPQPYTLYAQQKAWLALFDEDLPKRRALLASRDKGKSQIVSVLGVAWHLWRHRNHKIGIMSFKCAHADKLVAQVLRILRALGMAISHENGGYYLNENKDHTPSLMAMGLGSTVRMLHFDYLIMDDPLTIKEQFSRTAIQKCRYFLNEGSSIARKIILIGQLLTRHDIYHDAYTNEGGVWHTLHSWHGDIPQLDKDLEYEKRAMGSADVARNYLGYIDDADEAIFTGIQFDESLPENDLYAFIDPSAKGADFTALAIGWIHQARIIIYGKIYAQDWGSCLTDMIRLVQRCRIVYYEDNQGRALGQFLQNAGVMAQAVTTHQNKIAKIYGLYALVSQDRIRLSNSMDAMAISQVKNWTQTAQHDDLPDAIAMLVQKMGWKAWD